MITEQRLRFEAKHAAPPNVAFRQESNDYWIMNGSEYLLRCDEYNTLWQGYQSALEDRQGEAVAEVKLITGAPNSVIPFAPYIDIVASQPLPVGTQLFASPQPAQPDPLSIGTAQKEYDECMVDGEEPDPIERLRAFCSFAMEPQDWLDVEKFFDDVIAERADQWNAALRAVIALIEKQLEATSELNARQRQDLRLFIKAILALRKVA